MTESNLRPEDSLRIDNLVASVALLVAGIREDKAQRAQVLASLERIERAIAVPMTYTLKQTCRRIGCSLSWGQKNGARLPTPVSQHPIRYRIEDVEAMVRDPGPGIKKVG
jgi:hypothetical protein